MKLFNSSPSSGSVVIRRRVCSQSRLTSQQHPDNVGIFFTFVSRKGRDGVHKDDVNKDDDCLSSMRVMMCRASGDVLLSLVLRVKMKKGKKYLRSLTISLEFK